MSVEFRIGDVRKLLAEVPDGSVDLIATSWPYLAQRDYLPKDHPMKAFEIGQESTPPEFITTLLEVTAEFRRVLAPHGSIATELGDSFAGSGGGGGDYLPGGLREGQPAFTGTGRRASEQEAREANAAHWRQKNMTVSRRRDREPVPRNRQGGGKNGWPLERSLVMVPELYRVALAYGIHPLTGEPSPAGLWRVRNVVVHGRPNPPVGALGDKFRPACSTWAVACVNRRWFDLEAVRTMPKYPGDTGFRPSRGGSVLPDGTTLDRNSPNNPAGAPPLDWFEDENDQFERDLWTLSSSPYLGSHFATFSPELIRRFVVSMCPTKVCRVCGKPSKRIVEGSYHRQGRGRKKSAGSAGRLNGFDHPPEIGWERERTTIGWSDCGHGDWRPGLVLDPFAGSGTTLMVANGNSRDAIGFDLDARCRELARGRLGMFLDDPDSESA